VIEKVLPFDTSAPPFVKDSVTYSKIRRKMLV